MSFYSLIHGENPSADGLLTMLGLIRSDVGRFRDAWVDDDKIAIYTRNGGGNRECYRETFEKLEQHPNYLYDKDDDFDSTYATIYFSIPTDEEVWKNIDLIFGFDKK